MKNIIKIYLLTFFIYSFLFVFSFHLFYNPKEILFYQGLIFLFSILFLFFAFLFLLRKKIGKKFFHFFSALVFSFSFLLSFFVVFPVTFERSITMYLLKTVNQNQSITKKELEKKLINEYILKNQALEKRLNEQKIIDFIEVKKNKVYLTEKAKKFLKMANLIDKIFGINIFYE